MELHTRWCKFEHLQKETLESIWELRQRVFIIEQQSIYADIDGLDSGAWHLLLERNHQLMGYARLRSSEQSHCYKFERIVVAKPIRGQQQGKALMEHLISKARTLGEYSLLMLSAQTHLQSFYRQWGFEPQGQPYDDGGIMHIDMKIDLNREY